jgi:hypothetical protein
LGGCTGGDEKSDGGQEEKETFHKMSDGLGSETLARAIGNVFSNWAD